MTNCFHKWLSRNGTKKTVQDNTGMARCLVQEVCLDGHISQGWHSFLACMYHSAVATVWYCNLWTFQSSSEWGPRQVASVWLADFNNNKCVGLLVDFVGTYFDRWEKKHWTKLESEERCNHSWVNWQPLRRAEILVRTCERNPGRGRQQLCPQTNLGVEAVCGLEKKSA